MFYAIYLVSPDSIDHVGTANTRWGARRIKKRIERKVIRPAELAAGKPLSMRVRIIQA